MRGRGGRRRWRLKLSGQRRVGEGVFVVGNDGCDRGRRRGRDRRGLRAGRWLERRGRRCGKWLSWSGLGRGGLLDRGGLHGGGLRPNRGGLHGGSRWSVGLTGTASGAVGVGGTVAGTCDSAKVVEPAEAPCTSLSSMSGSGESMSSNASSASYSSGANTLSAMSGRDSRNSAYTVRLRRPARMFRLTVRRSKRLSESRVAMAAGFLEHAGLGRQTAASAPAAAHTPQDGQERGRRAGIAAGRSPVLARAAYTPAPGEPRLGARRSHRGRPSGGRTSTCWERNP